MKEEKCFCRAYMHPKGGHGFRLALNKPRLNNWSNLMIEWLNDLYKD